MNVYLVTSEAYKVVYDYVNMGHPNTFFRRRPIRYCEWIVAQSREQAMAVMARAEGFADYRDLPKLKIRLRKETVDGPARVLAFIETIKLGIDLR